MKKISTIFLICLSFSLQAQKKDTSVIPISELDTATLKNVEIEAAFPGGETAWNKYVQGVLEQNIDKLSKKKANFGTCEIQFIVEKDGSIKNAEALTMKNSLLAKLMIEAVKNGPMWTPAFQNGRKVKAWRRQKVTLLEPK
jgi:periplasmic protein TonB